MLASAMHPITWLCLVMLSLGGLLPFSSACSRKKASPEEEAQQFLDLVAKGETRRAYEAASFGFRTGQTLSNFEGAVKELGLTNYAGVTWASLQRSNDGATLEGEMSGKSGVKLPVRVVMIEQDGRWKLHSFRFDRPGDIDRFTTVGSDIAFVDSYNTTMPEDAKVGEMIRRTLLDFDAAIKEGNFTAFYAGVSKMMQDEVSLERFERSFQPFIEKGVSIAGVKDVDPVFTRPPRLRAAGVLEAAGFYPATPHKIHFELTYRYELPDWKLLGMEISLTK